MAGPKVSIISSTVPSSVMSRELLLAGSYWTQQHCSVKKLKFTWSNFLSASEIT